ncbi:MAG: AAA family ATPase [Desulfobacteraceae bacterium]|jgi:flagellar biosynthesis protein FlhG
MTITIPTQRAKTDKNSASKPNKIIAVGGAKGGIGKSVFCANLGVFLSSMNKRTILVDLDLGAANLHLFLGMWSLKHKLQDYLEKKHHSITDVLVTTPYGPYLAGGGGGKLGSAHIPFARKLKLIRALKDLDADYIILDLGGDTTYNSIDYFLAADVRLILSTCDPASYLDAYNFIKMALYRKLTRIFGPESGTTQERDPRLAMCIDKFVNSGLSGTGQKIEMLLEKIQKDHPAYLPMLQEILHHLTPYLVINMASSIEDSEQLAQRLKNVSLRMLSMDLNYLGSIMLNEEIKQCTLDLIPHVARYPKGILADFFQNISPII